MSENGNATMKEFDWEGFKNADSKVAVHCPKKTQAIDFCRKMHEHGLKWCSGLSLLENNRYDKYKKNTCYTSFPRTVTYDSLLFFKTENYTIIEWSDYMQRDDKAV